MQAADDLWLRVLTPPCSLKVNIKTLPANSKSSIHQHDHLDYDYKPVDLAEHFNSQMFLLSYIPLGISPLSGYDNEVATCVYVAKASDFASKPSLSSCIFAACTASGRKDMVWYGI